MYTVTFEEDGEMDADVTPAWCEDLQDYIDSIEYMHNVSGYEKGKFIVCDEDYNIVYEIEYK